MKVIITGTMNVDKLAKKLIEVADTMVAKMEAENGVVIEGYHVHEAEVTFKFDVEGAEHSQVMTVEHHAGQSELLTWIVDMEKELELSNEENSLYDKWTVAQATGTDFKFEVVESLYSEDELSYLPELDEAYSDMTKTVYEHVAGFKVVRVKQDGKLIQEYKLLPKA